MAPINYQHQNDRELEAGTAWRSEEKSSSRDHAPQSSSPSSAPTSPFAYKMSLRRLTVTFGLGLLVGFGLVTASHSNSYQSLCEEEIHAMSQEDMQNLVAQTKEDSSALHGILRCASPETFHRLVSVYFPDKNEVSSGEDRAAAIGKDETWLVTAWEKLVKRQEEDLGGAQTPPSDASTADADETVTERRTVTQGVPPVSSEAPPDSSQSGIPSDGGDAPSSTEPSVDPAPSTIEPAAPSSTETEVVEPSSSSQPPPPESTTTQQQPPTTSTESIERETSSTSTSQEEVSQETTTTKPQPETTSSSQEPETTSTSSDGTSTTEEAPSSSASSSLSSTSFSTSTVRSTSESVPERTKTSDKEDEDTKTRNMKTTLHRTSSAVKETRTSVLDNGSTTTMTSTSWVEVDPPKKTGEDEADPSLQDDGPSVRAAAGPAMLIGSLVAGLLML